jgi:hypothetical protein
VKDVAYAGSGLGPPSLIPKVFVGEFQVAFLMRFIQLASDAPVMLRGAYKRRGFFDPRREPPPGPRPIGLPNLMEAVMLGSHYSQTALNVLA